MKKLTLVCLLLLSVVPAYAQRVRLNGVSQTIPAPGATSNTQVLFNDAGTIGGDAGLTYVKATDTLTVGSLSNTGSTSSFGGVPVTGAQAMVYGFGSQTQPLFAFAEGSNNGGCSWGASPGCSGIFVTGSRHIAFTDGGTAVFQYSGAASPNSVTIGSAAILGWPAATPDVAFGRNAAGVIEVNSGTSGTFRDTKVRNSLVDNKITFTAFVIANIATVLTTNGDIGYCSDCTIANPCAGSGSGALAKRLNGVNVCN